MKKRLLMPLNLQYFADPEGGSEPGGQGATPAADPNPIDPENPADPDKKGEEVKTFTRDEVAKMIAAETSKAQKAWEKEEQERQAKAARQAKMTAEEKIKDELKEKDEEIAELKRSQALSKMNKEASKMFSGAYLPHDDDLLGLIVSDDEEATKEAVAIITNFASKIKKENARQKTPGEGGQFSSDKKENKSVADIAASTRIVK